MRLHMVLIMRFAQVALAAELAGVFAEALLAIAFVVQQLHVALVQNAPSELDVADIADVNLIHVTLDVTSSR